MGLWFEELDWRETPLGEISLRRRHDPTADTQVYEVKLNDEFLMSSLFTVAETELAKLALAELHRPDLRVLIGGLGLGYTAQAALADARVAELSVVETAEPVLDWHRRGLLPDTAGLATDSRCRLLQGDFFRLVHDDPVVRYDAIMLDIDHTPAHVLHPSHEPFYTLPGLTAMSRHLTADGVFTMWSDDPPDREFEATLAQVFALTSAHIVDFANPITDGESSNTVYLARHPRLPAS